MTTILLFVAEQIAEYAISKGLDKIFNNKEKFNQHLFNVISNTIDEYQKVHKINDQNGKFPFYKSQILIEELLKYRLYSINGYKFDSNKLQYALERNPNIIKPKQEEIEEFIKIFDKYLKADDKLKSLEIDEFHKEVIFDIYSKVEKILGVLEIQIVEVVPLLEEEYNEEISNCVEEIKNIKPLTALKRLSSLEERINRNTKHVTEKLKASLHYFKAVCFEALGLSNDAFESFIKSYKLIPDNIQYLEKACISYYFIEDPKYLELKSCINQIDEYNPITWAIDTFESADQLSFLKSKVPKNVIQKNYYKRLVFNRNLKDHKVDLLFLIELFEVNKLAIDLPTAIKYDNLHHYVFVLNGLSIDYFANTEIPIWGSLKKTDKLIQLYELSRVLTMAIKDGELGNSFNSIPFVHYWLESEIEINDTTISNIKVTFKSLKEEDPFKTVLFATTILKHEGIDKAIKVIEDYKGEFDENLTSLKTFCQLNNPQSEKVVIDYFQNVTTIDELNIQNISSYIILILKSHIISKDQLLPLLHKKNFPKEEYRQLVYHLVNSIDENKSTIPISEINSLKSKLEGESKLNYIIAFLLFENKYYEENIVFLESYLDEEKESRDLLLYIRCLDSVKTSNQLKLLRVLKKWRENFSFNDYLIRIEIELLQILKDWKEIKIIVKYALNHLPDEEIFYTLYIITAFNLDEKDIIREEINKVNKFDFRSTQNALKIANILIQLDFYSEALEIVYKKAINKTDSIARMNYLFLTTTISQDYFKDYETVTDGNYVRFDIDGQIETIHIDMSKKDIILVQKANGKLVGETFTIENPISKKFKTVRILRIMNKYSALAEDVFKEANSPFSNLPVESISFETKTKEGILKSFVDNFGAIENERRINIEKNFEEYYTFQKSFTEITNLNFDGSYLDAYYHLTSPQSDGLLIKPLKYINYSQTLNDKKIVIDFSTGLLLFELSERLKLKYDKFIVSGNTYHLFDILIGKTESERGSKMSITFYNNKMIPHIYSENFYAKRIEFIQKIKTWFINNTDSEIPIEKIEQTRPLYSEGSVTNAMEVLVDNAFLAQRHGYLLLSDDMIYEKLLRGQNTISSEKYLIVTFPERKNEILEEMLLMRYIGLSVNTELLYSAYINQHKEGYNHVYNYALRNLTLKENFVAFNIFISVEYLKKIALSSFITREQYRRIATNLFMMLIPSFPNHAFSFSLKKRIEQKFSFMGEYLNITLLSLLDALNMNNRSFSH